MPALLNADVVAVFGQLQNTYLFLKINNSVQFSVALWFPVCKLLLFMLFSDKMRVIDVLVLCLTTTFVCGLPKDAFHEELFLKHLPSGHVYAHFQFTTIWNTSLGDENACMFV